LALFLPLDVLGLSDIQKAKRSGPLGQIVEHLQENIAFSDHSPDNCIISDS